MISLGVPDGDASYIGGSLLAASAVSASSDIPGPMTMDNPSATQPSPTLSQKTPQTSALDEEMTKHRGYDENDLLAGIGAILAMGNNLRRCTDRPAESRVQ